MNNVKKSFSIRDMENLSGIKAHTIRIWEKRYNLFQPERTSTNIRTYSLTSLQKLLNVTLLYNHGYKISKIAKIDENELSEKVKALAIEENEDNSAINAFKLAMVNFDQSLFSRTYKGLREEKSFREVFYQNFLPFLNELGLLWQTDTISPSHEHFITHLIKQKIHFETEKLQLSNSSKNHVFALFLPENEIHELGLLYTNYELVLQGYKTIYLGQSTPIECLSDLTKYYDDITFISYFTVSPTAEKFEKYIDDFSIILKETKNSRLWLLGHQIRNISASALPKDVKAFNSIDDLLKTL